MKNKIPDQKKELWHGYESFRFEQNSSECVIVKADSPLKGDPWVWRVRFFNAEPAFDLAMLRHGFHLAHIDISLEKNAIQTMDGFYRFLVEEMNFSEKTILESYSRGANPALNWSVNHPEKISMIFLDRPLWNQCADLNLLKDIPLAIAYDKEDPGSPFEKNAGLILQKRMNVPGCTKQILCKDGITSDDAEALAEFALKQMMKGSCLK